MAYYYEDEDYDRAEASAFEDEDGPCEGCWEDCDGCVHNDTGHDFCDPEYDRSYDLIDGVGFANPGGNSALRAATRNNPRDCDCPTCGARNVLTRVDRQRGYQCDSCADRAERGY